MVKIADWPDVAAKTASVKVTAVASGSGKSSSAQISQSHRRKSADSHLDI